MKRKAIGLTIAELRYVLGNPFFLVVDGGSTDKTLAIAKGFGAEVLFQKSEGKGEASMLLSRRKRERVC
jgi:glycosyltransferase involved in cell wall biosynthesis